MEVSRNIYQQKPGVEEKIISSRSSQFLSLQKVKENLVDHGRDFSD